MFVGILAITATGCGIFGGGPDAGVESMPTYRRVNSVCAQMVLPGPTMTVEDVRKILGCFNAYGALRAIAKVFDRMSDGDIAPLVAGFSKYVIKNPALLHRPRRTYLSLDREGSLAPALDQLGSLLARAESRLRDGGAAALNQAYLGSGEADPVLLKAVEKLAVKLTSENTRRGDRHGTDPFVGARVLRACSRDFELRPAGRGAKSLRSRSARSFQILFFGHVVQSGQPRHYGDSGPGAAGGVRARGYFQLAR